LTDEWNGELACFEAYVFAVRLVELWTGAQTGGAEEVGGWRTSGALIDFCFAGCAGGFASETLLNFNGVELDRIAWTTLETLAFDEVEILITCKAVNSGSATFAISRTLLATHCCQISKIAVLTLLDA